MTALPGDVAAIIVIVIVIVIIIVVIVVARVREQSVPCRSLTSAPVGWPLAVPAGDSKQLSAERGM
jgi:uncharacterized protein (DUF983 family)